MAVYEFDALTLEPGLVATASDFKLTHNMRAEAALNSMTARGGQTYRVLAAVHDGTSQEDVTTRVWHNGQWERVETRVASGMTWL